MLFNACNWFTISFAFIVLWFICIVPFPIYENKVECKFCFVEMINGDADSRGAGSFVKGSSTHVKSLIRGQYYS